MEGHLGSMIDQGLTTLPAYINPCPLDGCNTYLDMRHREDTYFPLPHPSPAYCSWHIFFPPPTPYKQNASSQSLLLLSWAHPIHFGCPNKSLLLYWLSLVRPCLDKPNSWYSKGWTEHQRRAPHLPSSLFNYEQTEEKHIWPILLPEREGNTTLKAQKQMGQQVMDCTHQRVF